MSVWDYDLLDKLQEVFQVSQEVKKSDLASFLGISEELLFKKIISWGKALQIKIKGDLIILEDLSTFEKSRSLTPSSQLLE